MITRPGQTGSLALRRRKIMIDLLISPASLDEMRQAQAQMAALTVQIEDRLNSVPKPTNPNQPNPEGESYGPDHS